MLDHSHQIPKFLEDFTKCDETTDIKCMKLKVFGLPTFIFDIFLALIVERDMQAQIQDSRIFCVTQSFVFVLQAIQDMNTLKRMIRLAETDHYSLFR